MKLKFTNISLNNFLSFGEAELSLDNNGYTLVSGINNNPDDLARSNGSGKSSIWEAIIWCLTGETIRGTKDVVRIGSTTGCSVSLEFFVGKDKYKIVRTKDPSNLKVIINDVDKSGKGIRDTEKLLSEYLPDLTSSLLGSVVILGQGLPQRFTNNTPSGRKEVLEKLSKSDFMIEDLKNRIKSRKETLDSSLRQEEDNIIRLDAKKSILESSLKSSKDKLSNLQEPNKDKIVELETELQQLDNQIENAFQEKEENNNNYLLVLDQYTQAKDKLTDDINRIKDESAKKINDYTQTINEIQLKIKSLNDTIRAKTTDGICPTCGQPLPGHEKLSADAEKEEVTLLNKDKSNVESLKEQELELIREKEKDLKEEFSKKYSDVDILKGQLKSKIDESNELFNKLTVKKNNVSLSLKEEQYKIDNYSTTKTNLEKEIEDYMSEIENISTGILYHNNEKESIYQHVEVINKMNTIVTRDFRGYLLINIINYIDMKSKEYCKDVFDTDKISFTQDGNNISISYDGKEYECLSGGEKQKVDLIVQLAIRSMLCKFLDFTSNIIVLDELFDNLDSIGCERVLNLISNKLSDVESIYIVTHRVDFPVPCDKEITIVKGVDKISKIQ